LHIFTQNGAILHQTQTKMILIPITCIISKHFTSENVSFFNICLSVTYIKLIQNWNVVQTIKFIFYRVGSYSQYRVTPYTGEW